MAKVFVALCPLFISACLYGAELTNVAELVGAIATNASPNRAFSLSADILYRLEHVTGVMLLLAEGGHSVVANYDPAIIRVGCHVGDRIRCAGTIRPDNTEFGRPVLTNATYLGHVPVPAFPERRISTLLNGECDWSPAVVCGTVRNAVQSETSPRWAYLILNSSDGGINVSLPKGDLPISRFDELIGRRIRVKGFAVPFDGSSRRYQGRIFQCDGLNSLQAVDAHPNDPFNVPDIAEIKNRHPTAIAALGMHCVRGIVLTVWHPGNVLLRTANDQVVRVELRGADTPHAGQHIVAVGLPESNLFHINLTHARWRPTGDPPAPFPPACETTAAAILRPHGNAAIDANWHGRHIRLTGIVRGNQDNVSNTRKMSLENGPDIITVNFGEAPLEMPPSGSTIEATGTCVMDIPSWRTNLDFPQIGGFTLVLDTANGLKVLATPSWWTPVKLLSVIGALLTALFAFVLWNVSLRRLAERKGRALLREQIKGVQSQLQVAERTRLSVELHDSLAQSLGGVAMELQTALASDPAAADGKDFHLAIAAQSLKSCRAELRNCLWDLRSEALDEPDMTRAIYRTLQPQINDARLQVRFNVPRAHLSDTTAHAILRVVRELVVNALRHGRATVIRVAGSLDATQLMFAVRDNGCGFDPATCPGIAEGHFGLQGIRERVERIGGEVRIDSTVGSGTRVTVTLPTHKLTQG